MSGITHRPDPQRPGASGKPGGAQDQTLGRPDSAEPRVRTPRLDPRTKILYGLGEIANTTKLILFGLFTLYFYATVMGLSGTLVGIASAAALVWDAVIDPYIGYLSDKSHSRLGRRHSFMVAGAVTMGLSFWAFFSPPRGLSTGALFAWMLIFSLLVRTATSVYGVPYYALGAELSQDYHERTSIVAIRGFLALLGTLAAASLSFVVFFPDRTPGADPKLNYGGYPAMGLTFGLAMTLVSLIATVGTLGLRSSLHRVDPGTAARPASFFRNSGQALRNPSFRLAFIWSSLFFLGVVINNALSLHYFTYYAGITASAALSTFQLAFYLGGLAGVGCWLSVSRVVEKHWLCLMATLATALLMCAALLLVGEGRLFGTGNAPALTAGHALAGFFGSVLWFMPGSMIADAADEDELASGQRREGLFFGIYSFGHQLAGGVSVLLAGVLVDRYAQLASGTAAQSAQTVWRIGLLYSALPALLLAAAAVAISRYSLSERRMGSIRSELDRRSVLG